MINKEESNIQVRFYFDFYNELKQKIISWLKSTRTLIGLYWPVEQVYLFNESAEVHWSRAWKQIIKKLREEGRATSHLKSFFVSPQFSVSFNVQDGGRALVTWIVSSFTPQNTYVLQARLLPTVHLSIVTLPYYNSHNLFGWRTRYLSPHGWCS